MNARLHIARRFDRALCWAEVFKGEQDYAVIQEEFERWWMFTLETIRMAEELQDTFGNGGKFIGLLLNIRKGRLIDTVFPELLVTLERSRRRFFAIEKTASRPISRLTFRDTLVSGSIASSDTPQTDGVSIPT